MSPENNDEPDYQRPVAYSPEGQPLYAHPPKVHDEPKHTPADATQPPQVVYLTRAVEPHKQEIPPEIQQKHDESVSRYPELNLSEGEYVISAIRRHPIGVISIWLVILAAVVLVLAIPFILTQIGSFPINLSGKALVSGAIVLVLVVILLILGGIVSTMVYDANRFYLTNESVVQHTQFSLFTKRNQTISLGSVEDASFKQKGIVQTLLNYGSIRLSTEGEESTYRFNFVANPQKQINLLNDAVEAFKNFRPIDESSD